MDPLSATDEGAAVGAAENSDPDTIAPNSSFAIASATAKQLNESGQVDDVIERIDDVIKMAREEAESMSSFAKAAAAAKQLEEKGKEEELLKLARKEAARQRMADAKARRSARIQEKTDAESVGKGGLKQEEEEVERKTLDTTSVSEVSNDTVEKKEANNSDSAKDEAKKAREEKGLAAAAEAKRQKEEATEKIRRAEARAGTEMKRYHEFMTESKAIQRRESERRLSSAESSVDDSERSAKKSVEVTAAAGAKHTEDDAEKGNLEESETAEAKRARKEREKQARKDAAERRVALGRARAEALRDAKLKENTDGGGTGSVSQDASQNSTVQEDLPDDKVAESQKDSNKGKMVAGAMAVGAVGGVAAGIATTRSGDELSQPQPPIDSVRAVAVAADSNEGPPDMMINFRLSVENLVAEVMPTEVEHVDELIGEYVGREAELLDTLTSLQQIEGSIVTKMADGAVTVGAVDESASEFATKSEKEIEPDGAPAVAANLDEENIELTQGDGSMNNFRSLIEMLVAEVMPTEVDHVDAMMAEYKGREEELLETLTAMQQNEEVLTHHSDMSESELSSALDDSEKRTSQVLGDGEPALPKLLSYDENEEPVLDTGYDVESGVDGNAAVRAQPRVSQMEIEVPNHEDATPPQSNPDPSKNARNHVLEAMEVRLDEDGEPIPSEDRDKSDRNDDQPPPWWKKHQRWICLVICLLIVFIVALAVGLSLRPDNDNKIDRSNENDEPVDVMPSSSQPSGFDIFSSQPSEFLLEGEMEAPTSKPTVQPPSASNQSGRPSSQSFAPSATASLLPSLQQSASPTFQPTLRPTSYAPSKTPSKSPISPKPTYAPSATPSTSVTSQITSLSPTFPPSTSSAPSINKCETFTKRKPCVKSKCIWIKKRRSCFQPGEII